MKPKNQNRFLSTARLCLPLASAITVLFSLQSVQAVSNSWAANAAGNWATAASWTGGVNIPGSTSDNTDVATFSFTLATSVKTVTVDSNRFIGGITFGNTSTLGYTLSGGSLRLNSGGVIQSTGTVGAHTDTISSPIQISGTSAATASFTSSPTTAANGVILISGGVTGSATSPNTTTLTLNGTGTGANTVSGIIGNGSGGGTLALAKSGAGTWALSGANTYSGGTTLNGGIVTISNAASFGTGSVTVSGASRINATSGIIYANAISVGTQTLTMQNPATTTSTATFNGVLSGTGTLSLPNSGTNGQQGILAFTNTANTFTGNVVLSASGSGDEHFSFNSIGDGGNFTFAKNGNRQLVTYSGSSSVTFATRTINIASSMTNITTRQGLDGGGGNPVSSFFSSGGGPVTFNSNMTMTSLASDGVFYFNGTNTGSNTYAGLIADPTSTGRLWIGKLGAGT